MLNLFKDFTICNNVFILSILLSGTPSDEEHSECVSGSETKPDCKQKQSKGKNLLFSKKPSQ